MLCTLGRSADPWRVAKARDHRLRTHGVPVSAGPTDETVADLAYIPREPHRHPGVRLDGDLVVRDERWRRRRLYSPVPPCSAITRRAVRFKSVGIGRLASFAPIDVSWLACRTASASPPHTFQDWQGSADLMGRQPVLAAYGWRFLTLKKSILANELLRGPRPFDSESLVAIGKLWLTLRAIRSSTRLVSRHCLRSWY